MKLAPGIFREYDIRGIADRDLSDDTVYALGRAMGTMARRTGGRRMTLGRDCRLSSPRITEALKQALRDTGLDVVDVGLVPTPLLYYSVHRLETAGGIMVTGSHNPQEHNGFKICIGKSTIFGSDIQRIRQLAEARDFESGQGALANTDVVQDYIEHVTSNIRHPLGLKIAVDSGNGMAGPVAPRLYRALGCEVTELYSEPDGSFPNHHPDPTVPENLAALRKAISGAGAVFGIAFDGDADRIGVVDRSGRILYGDELLVIYARDVLAEHPGAAIISEVKASHRLFQDIAHHGGRPIMWKTGHSLIKAKMREEASPLAGEMSGHMFFADRYYGFDDAIYAGARLLEIVAKHRKTPAELIADLPPSFTTPEIRVDCPDDRKFWVVEQAKLLLERQGHRVNGIDGARVEFADGWGLVRASNTQPVLVFRFEGSSAARLAEIRVIVESAVAGFLKR